MVGEKNIFPILGKSAVLICIQDLTKGGETLPVANHIAVDKVETGIACLLTETDVSGENTGACPFI